jgi:prepilin-type N-terminal cleavage/methylation domain-containing protein
MKTHGFSLIELSIVLVILGLLSGGILAGQSMIRAAELRSVTSDFQRYSTATYSFRDKYFAYPGDMADALRFWPNCAAIGTNVCYGDGDGMVEDSPTSATGSEEKVRAWQHFAFAGLIEGSYSGDWPAAGPVVPGRDVPASKISRGGYWYGLLVNHYGKTAQALEFGAARTGNHQHPAAGILSPEETWNIDIKLDDGLASQGKFLGVDGLDQTGCVDASPVSSVLTANYVLTQTGKYCRPMFLMP